MSPMCAYHVRRAGGHGHTGRPPAWLTWPPATRRRHGTAPRSWRRRRHGAGAASRPAEGRARPPSRRRVDHEVRVSACRTGRGSRRRASTRSPSSHGTPVAFPSHLNGRSPIACGSPRVRLCRRPSGDRAAMPVEFRSRRHDDSPAPLSFSPAWTGPNVPYQGPANSEFQQRQAGVSPLSALCFVEH